MNASAKNKNIAKIFEQIFKTDYVSDNQSFGQYATNARKNRNINFFFTFGGFTFRMRWLFICIELSRSFRRQKINAFFFF